MIGTVLAAAVLLAAPAYAHVGKWDPELLSKQADVVAQVELIESRLLRDAAGAVCGARYSAKVVAVEKGNLRDQVIKLSTGPDFEFGRLFRVYLRSVKTEEDFYESRVPRRDPSVQLPPDPGWVVFLKCPGVIPGWVVIGLERLP